MPDVIVTATNVVPDSGTQTLDAILGAAVTAGQTLYLDAADAGKAKLADANASAATAAVRGIALNGGAIGQPVKLAIGGTLNPGFAVGVGSVYVLSATPGGIAPVADLAVGWFTHVLGIGVTASQLKLVMQGGGVAIP
ncbi:MAG: hypothetical protein L0211_24420 [Planctomycetaceae bacterium]|nr:hypothetical protein [Planctomycetaceae bacterium]